ncbi:CLUMA_CG001795, isoform A [Clunio marinus]|uniref:CLUMA_CG001795, isoform A n=1 Tax=Clunio marinus TaxID=568069 RepID=A0A1J1HP60_9DIPT|nr:CLUMA_CG001795, isoform A [Clunio marinus]
MSLISDLCRLCLINCSSLGIPVYSNVIRRDKIRDCLSIIIEDDPRFPLIICNECDVKLNCFNQFRIDSIRAQHEFANIVKSLHGIVHYDQNNQSGYYTPELEPIKSIENMYNNPDGLYTTSSAPPTIVQNSQDYDIQFRYDLHLALDDENTESHVESHSLGNIPPNENMFEIVQQPHISPLSPATPSMVQQTSSQGIKIESSCPEQIIELSSKSPAVNTDNCYIENLGVEQQSNVGFDIDTNHDDDSFTYDDFDDTCQSMPSDRNNVDNVIDRKIEEFIQNKTVNRVNPKICTVCNKLFRTNYKLRMHMETHSENNAKYVCEVQSCCRSFKSKIGLQEHSAVHTGIYNFTCEVCSKKFVIRSYFKAHQRVHFKEKQKSFPCSHCPKILNSKQNLIDHENHHLGLKLYKCEICLKSISTKTHLDVHMKSHNSCESFLCTTCNKHFKTKNYLKIHLKTHDESLKNYCCGFCGKKFIQMSDLKIHIKTHTGERSFICETCGRAFARKDSLSLHTKTHTQEKQFSCHCGLKFIRKHPLTNHIKKCDQLYRISNETMDL